MSVVDLDLVAAALAFEHRGCGGRMVLDRVTSRGRQRVGVFCCDACGGRIAVGRSGSVILQVVDDFGAGV